MAKSRLSNFFRSAKRKIFGAYSPTKTIERTNPTLESVFFKKPGDKLASASEHRYGHQVSYRRPNTDETMSLHDHNSTTGKRQTVLPSSLDIRACMKESLKNIRTHFIAIRIEGKVAGYVAIDFRKANVELLESLLGPKLMHPLELHAIETELEKKNHPIVSKDFETKLRFLQEAGLRFRFIPNKKRNYLFENGQFVRAEGKK